MSHTGEGEREVVFFHPIPLVLFPSCYKLRERCWVSAEPVLVGWRGVELKLIFHGGKRVGKEGERPSLLGGFRAAAFLCQGWMWHQPDVAETSAGCAGPVSSSASPNPGVSPRKRHPQLHNHQPATHPSPLGKDWEKGRIFQPVCRRALVSTSQACRSFGFPQPGTFCQVVFPPCQVVFPAGKWPFARR